MRNSRKATNLASEFDLVTTAILTFMIPDEQIATMRICIAIPSESFVNFKV